MLPSVSCMPSICAAWALTSAQVGRPATPSSMRPVATGMESGTLSPLESTLNSYSRRKTWCEAWDV
ncbi:hypothetical protein D9M71_221220 [compost metagenome]